MYDKNTIQTLFQKYLEQSLTPPEEAVLSEFLARASAEEVAACIGRAVDEVAIPEDLSELKPKTDQILTAISKRIPEGPPVRKLQQQKVFLKNNPQLWRYAVAAFVGVLVLVSLYHYYQSPSIDTFASVSDEHIDIRPGTNSATLKLADGQLVDLSVLQSGTVLKGEDADADMKIEGGVLLYADNSNTSAGYNEIRTPRGGQYKVRLADGTMVHLNADSKLTYPSSFNGKASREVHLSGEAFFEVAKNNGQPFVVSNGDTQVKVLGTKFMLSGYADEPFITTTLLEGRVEVKNGQNRKILHPDEQAIAHAGRLDVVPTDAVGEIAWIHGEFVFNNASLDHIMNRLARWYNVQVEFDQAGLKAERYEGVVSRFESLQKVLTMLERTNKNVKFKLVNHKVNISKK